MRILEIREAIVPISSPIRNAYIDFSKMTASVVAVITDQVRDGRPVVGYGFNSNGRYAASGLLNERFLPRLREAAPETLLADDGFIDPAKVWDALMANEKPGGHGERSVAVGVIDMAVWDAVAKARGVPLWRHLADAHGDGTADENVFVYAAGGYYHPGKDDRQLQEEMRRYLGMGYEVVKMKIGGASLDEDLRRIEAVLAVVGEGRRLAVDANGRFDLETALAYAGALRPYELFWYEEAGDPLDYALQAELPKVYPHPMATGENLFSHQDARNLARYGGMRPDRDWLQFDCALSYGLVEYLRTLKAIAGEGFGNRNCIPHGGHQLSLNIAAGLKLGGNESYPEVFAPFGGFADGVRIENGRVGLPDAPGVGFELKGKLIAAMREATGT
ncbi:mandelate racemase/muconate lactonizing enzyme family protein [Rubrimonas cliftonensis]|uniref:L-alanine-DL-glutamate epimerase n=1 Tax=Rubrimonas cliftonensis TaxID=89524 RepID=A0A1H3Z0J6_9RHOB|nr:mandelate racemase/muconate lactonizing enzyme family protein [Rubrimonas cliftonensis]SEA17363.1 L-alanine-DL-glutamate epimerase [Rubrimonas cliftonensis]